MQTARQGRDEKGITINHETKRVMVSLPFVRDEVEFLRKKHQGDDNRYQALRVYKTQCRKPEAIKEQLRNTQRDLVDRGFMVRFESLSKEQRKAHTSATIT
jgi:LAS superfamily LD-carboxypeptidase LdcB